MAREDVEILAFNRGVVSKLALARVDIKRVAMSAEEQVNFIPRVLGPMSLRPGFQYIGASIAGKQAWYLPFVFSTDDSALIELTDGVMRVLVNDVLVTRVAVATVITNDTFATGVASWTDVGDVGGVSGWDATLLALSLRGTGSASARRYSTVTVAAGDIGKQHALEVEVLRGEVALSIGTTVSGIELLSTVTLALGFHSLAFTPTATTIYVGLEGRNSHNTLVGRCAIAPSGVMQIPTPWVGAVIAQVRSRQSGDVLFISCEDVRQIRIERRGANSWSLVDYVANVGPFRVGNTTPITMVASALNGLVTLTASNAFFRTTNVGGLIAIDSTGQAVTKVISSADVFSDPIRVSGIGSGRVFGITITGTWVATVALQRSVGAIGNWVDVTSYTVNQSTTLSDTLDNQIIFYRIGIKPGNYTSGTATVELSYSAGTIRGVIRLHTYTSATQMLGEVVKDLGSLTATVDWLEGAWSARRGFPSAVGIYEGRVWWAGKDKINGSVSDGFDNHDDSVVGDSAPIARSIGIGPVDTINWLLEGQQLLLGAEGAELICRSNSLGDLLTTVNFNLKPATSRGSLGVDAVSVDTSGVFVDRSGTRIYELEYDRVGTSYAPIDLTAIAPEIGKPSIVRIGVQRRPDTRLHCIRSDGTVAVLVYDKSEDVKAWVVVDTSGSIEDVVVLPGTEEDQVYYSVKRTINAVVVRYLEKWAKQSECEGGAVNRQADAFVYYSGAAITLVAGLSHLEGRTVVCWADGKDVGTYVVTGGSITLAVAATNIVVGLTYRARYRSVKGKYLTKHKKIDRVGVLLLDTHYQGLKYGQSFDYLDPLPLVEDGLVTPIDTVWADYDNDNLPFNGMFDTNARLCLEANAPKPCTVSACIITSTTHDK